MRFLQRPDLFLTAVQGELKAGIKNFIQEFSFEKELQKLKKQINRFDSQGKILVQLFHYQVINQDSLPDGINSLNKEMS